MDINELMIGNLIQYKDKSTICEVSNLGHFFETINELGLAYGSDDINDYTPIKLTSEWLLKFGFIFDEKIKCWKYYNLILNELFVMMDIDIHVYIEHVHQLQNLYFALTGYKIEIKK